MACKITQLEIKISPRLSHEGNVCGKIHYHFMRDGIPLYALSHVNYPINDTPHQRAIEAEAFIKRQSRDWPETNPGNYYAPSI